MADDRQILGDCVRQVLELDLTAEHGWGEGVSYYASGSTTKLDVKAGESLVRRGVLVRSQKNPARLMLSEAAVARILRVAVASAVDDLIANDPPAEALPPVPSYFDNGAGRLIMDFEGGLEHREMK